MYLSHPAAASFLYARAVSGFTTTALGGFSSKELSEYMCVFANVFAPCSVPTTLREIVFLWSSLTGAEAMWKGSSSCSTSAAGGEKCVWLWRSGLAGEVGEERRRGRGKEKKKKPKPLNSKTALLTSGQHVPYRLQEAVGAQVRGAGWAAAERSTVKEWGILGHQESGEVWRCTAHDRQSIVTLQQTQPGAQVEQMHGLCKVCKSFISLTFDLLCNKAESRHLLSYVLAV